jgi:hypothetical protein
MQKGHEAMQFDDLQAVLDHLGRQPVAGPVAVIGIEDEVESASTLRHHLQLGFKTLIALMPPDLALPRDLESRVLRVTHVLSTPDALVLAMGRIMKMLPEDVWVYYCYNAEYLFFPFCETRSVGELLGFQSEERRDALLTYVVDLYADDLENFSDAVSIERAHLDRTGYYALARTAPPHGHPKERQLDFFGGLRWRFEEHVPQERRRIDRISLFRNRKGLTLAGDFTFSEEEYNTYACPWHNNLTAAVCSFRTAKALKRNPGSRNAIKSFMWHNSVPFEWHSGQLLDLGLIEPGQWF